MAWPAGADSIEFRAFTADIEKFTSATGWNPLINLKEGILLISSELLKRDTKHND